MTKLQNSTKIFNLFSFLNIFRLKHPIIFSLFLMFWSILIILFVIKTAYPSKPVITRYHLQIIKNEILKKHTGSNISQNNLNKLSLSKEKEKYLKDAWGNPIQIKLKNPNTITLTSFGKDGIPGKEPDIFIDFKIIIKNKDKNF